MCCCICKCKLHDCIYQLLFVSGDFECKLYEKMFTGKKYEFIELQRFIFFINHLSMVYEKSALHNYFQ